MTNILNILKNFFKSKNEKIDKDEHWDIFNETYYEFISNIDNWSKFRINGMSNMLETGLPSQERDNLIINNKRYDINYSNDEIMDLIERFNELIEYCGDRFIYNNMNSMVGTPRHYNYKFNDKEYILNFDDLYHIYGLWQLKRVCNELKFECKTIVEIGGGYGNLAMKIISNFKNVKYIIIDLPEILAIQHYYLSQNNQKLKIVNYVNYNNEDYDVLLVPSNLYKKLNIKIDILINMRSFGEMTTDILNDYFNWIDINLNNDGLIYLVNRYVFTKSKDKLKLRDYPFKNNWNILLSQPQWLQTHLHELILQNNSNTKLNVSFLMKSMPIRTPPPGPIMKFNTQDEWIKHQKI